VVRERSSKADFRVILVTFPENLTKSANPCRSLSAATLSRCQSYFKKEFTVKKILLLLAVSVLALSLSVAPAVAGNNPVCPPNFPQCGR